MEEEEKNPPPRRGPFLLFALLHLVCCGLPLLLLSGVSASFIFPAWPVIGGVLAALGVIGFVWYLRRGCATCPRNEGLRHCDGAGSCRLGSGSRTQR